MTSQHDLNATTSLDPLTRGVAVSITDNRSDSTALFEALPECDRHGLAEDAWRVGLRAVMGAQRQAEESRLADLSTELRDNLEQQCRLFVERQEHALRQALARYFDPHDGQVVERLQEFVRDGGTLARAMDAYLAPERGALATTLAQQVGAASPLLKALSPSDKLGFLQVLEERIGAVLAAQQQELGRALDPHAEDGAIARFMCNLRKELQTANADQQKLLQLSAAALDANNPGSALSRLMNETRAAKDALARAMNPEVPESPLAIVRSTLSGMIQQSAKAQQEALANFEAKQLKGTQEIRDLVARIEERRRNDARTTRGGFNFQDSVVEFVSAAVANAPVAVDITANLVGSLPACKVGDVVLELTSESSCPGTRVVIEAKRENGFTTSRALKELETARTNRDCTVGIAVVAKSHAPKGASALARHGKDILVVWDDQDDTSDPYLHAALLLGLAIASRTLRKGDDADIKALANIEGVIQKELDRLDKMRDLSAKIEKHAREMQEEVRKSGDKMESLLKKAKSTLRALNVELEAEDVDMALPSDSLQTARAALDPPDKAESNLAG